ncbi:hemocyte defensin Cg-Defh2-like [Crassostrea virginica]
MQSGCCSPFKRYIFHNMKVFLIVTVLLIAFVGDVSTGFMCPRNHYLCDQHCRSLGCFSGYCSGILNLRCYCTGCTK